MASSLSQQLSNIAKPQTGILEHKKKKASLLFKQREIADKDGEFFYNIGRTGFQALVEIDERFTKFEDRLFGKQTKALQRYIKSDKFNRKLDKTIEEFLILLSPYLEKEASLKALEWLIHRFYINEMNVDALIMCIFPYYETLLFVRILQVIDIRKKEQKWIFLYEGALRGRTIPKDNIFLQWSSNQWFRNFIENYFYKYVKVHKEDGQCMKNGISLLVSTVIGGLSNIRKITDDHVSTIWSSLELSFTINDRNVLCATLLVVANIAIAARLTPELQLEIIKRLVKVSDPEVMESSTLCLLTFFFHQKITTIPPEIVREIEKHDLLLAQVSKLCHRKPVSQLVSPLIKESLKMTMTDDDLSEKMKNEKIISLVDLIKDMPLVPSESSIIIRSFLHGISNFESYLEGHRDSLNLVNLLKKLETNHPEGFDEACRRIKDSTNSDNKFMFELKLINEFKEKWVLIVEKSPEPDISSPIVPRKNKTTSDEQWLECLRSGKLTSACVKFLEEMCSKITLPTDKADRPFWHICGEDDFSSMLKLLIKILRVIVFHQIQKKNSKLCSRLLTQIFNEILGSRKKQLYFLSMIIGWNMEVEDVGIDRILKFWALNLTDALLATATCSLTWVLEAKEPMVVSLVTPLCEGEYLSEAAFKVLQQIHGIVGARLNSGNLAVLVEELLSNKEEITAYISYIPTAVSSLAIKNVVIGKKMVESLMGCVTDSHTPLHIKSSVLYLMSSIFNNNDIMAQLIPIGNEYLDEIGKLQGKLFDKAKSNILYYILTRFSDDVKFIKVEGGWDLFHRSLQMPDAVLQLRVADRVVSPQELVVNYRLLREIPDFAKQLDVLDLLITRIIQSDVSNEASKLSKELKKMKLTAEQILSLWKNYDLIARFSSIREAKVKRLKVQHESRDSTNMEGWRKLALSLEFVGMMEDLQNPWLLIGPICDHLQVLMKFETSFADNLQQQMLSVVFHLLEISKKNLDEKEFVQQCKLNIALIVQCIRTSVNPDIHRRALLILSLAAEYFPEHVLHNIMAIFTFMGTSLLRRDDAYSFHVIHLTIESIVPTLIKAETSEPKILLKKLSQVTQVFVDALPDLAEHRRLPLFKQLATTLGVSQHLWLVMVQIADAYVSHTATAEEASSQEEDPRGLPRNIRFALVLYSQFSVIDQLKASREVVDFVINLPESKESIRGVTKIKDMNSSTLVINVLVRTSRQLRQLKYTCLGLLVHLLSSDRFVRQVFEAVNQNCESDLKELKELYESLLAKSLEYLKSVCQNLHDQKGTPAGKFWSAMERKLIDLVDAINSLLPPELLLQVVSSLLNTTSAMIRCRAMEILASKLQPDAKFFSDEVASNLVEFIAPLIRIAEDSKEQEENRQTALFTLQLLVRRLHSVVEPELLSPILGTSASLIKPKESSVKVVAQAALVVAESIHVMKVFSLVHLNNLVHPLISILEDSLKADSYLDNLIIAAATALHRIVENIPRLLPRNYVETLFVVCCRLITKHEEEDRQRDSKLTNRLTNVLELLIYHLEARVILPSLTKIFERLCSEDVTSVPSLMQFIETLLFHIKDHNELSLYKKHLNPLFTQAFDVRYTCQTLDSKSMDRIENCVIAAATRFLFKLTGEENVEFVSSLLTWAWSDMDQKPARLITFFRFTSYLANGLKVLFIKTKIVQVVYPKAAEILDRNNNLLHRNTIFGKGVEAEELAIELLQYVLETLSSIFLYDSVGFTNDSRFKTIAEPLTNQIENTIGTKDQYWTRISTYLKTCIIRLTKAVTDDSLWKELNCQILLRLRSNKLEISLAGLEVFEGLVEAMGEDYLQPLLADTIPCIIEVLESEKEEVQKKATEILNKMEAILGDSLRAYYS